MRRGAQGKIRETHEHMVFLAESDSGQSEYRVDLIADNGQGRCSCKDFECAVTRARKKGEIAFCKHIARSFTFFGWMQAQAIAKQYAENKRRRGIHEA